MDDIQKQSEFGRTSAQSSHALQAELEAAKQLAETNLNGWKRALADYQNAQKEMHRHIEDLTAFQFRQFLISVLPLHDSFIQALRHIPDHLSDEPWAKGLQHIQKQWGAFFSTYGVTQINALGARFDPEQHEAIETKHESTAEDGVILQVQREGYRYNKSILRPAQVVVNKIINQ